MALDMYLVLKGVKGETKDDAFKGKGGIDILAWSFGVSNSGSAHMGGGIGSGKANFQDISITKYIDLSSAALMQSVSKGTHFDTAEITVRKAGGTALEYYKIALSEVMVTSYQTGGSGGEDRLTESITLTFAKVEVKYQAQNEKGAAAGDTSFGYDIAGNKESAFKAA
jgi:type VI secretion system secreted protein Hcp